MSRKTISIIALLLVFALTMFVLAGCNDGNDKRAVESIRIIDGSFKNVYALDEELDLSNAKISVTYTNGDREPSVRITADMVSGFDSSRIVTGAIMTITYKGVSANYLYNVESSGEKVETAFRLKAEVKAQSATSNSVTIRGLRAKDVENGVYAISFTLTGTDGVAFDSSITSKIGGDWKMSVHFNSASSVKVVLYSASGTSKLPNDCDLIEVTATTISVKGRINIQSAKISDGVKDYVVPASYAECVVG